MASVISKETKNGVDIYVVKKLIPDEKLTALKNTHVKPSQIDLIIKKDADVFDESGELLLRFRKDKLSRPNVDAFYDNVIIFARKTTNNRGSASGSGSGQKNVWSNPKIMTNIIGYFDSLSPQQKFRLKQQGKTMRIPVRPTRFLVDYPDKFEELIPLVREIDKYYKQYTPEQYAKQRKKANETQFKIDGTAFTTITTNVNFRTTIHTDTGDDAEGFGNLAVIERGTYAGGETCFPQYGIGVDVRTCDVLYMNVHKAHGNLPMKNKSADATRLSIVCYLRKGVWERTRGKSRKFRDAQVRTIRNIRKPHK
jgi:hypothetical protein